MKSTQCPVLGQITLNFEANGIRLYLYRKKLSERLRCTLPTDTILCRNVNCDDDEHFHQLNAFAMVVTSSCINTTAISIPPTCDRCGSRCVPGWSEVVQPLQETSSVSG